jgi:hypothetical protein
MAADLRRQTFPIASRRATPSPREGERALDETLDDTAEYEPGGATHYRTAALPLWGHSLDTPIGAPFGALNPQGMVARPRWSA